MYKVNLNNKNTISFKYILLCKTKIIRVQTCYSKHIYKAQLYFICEHLWINYQFPLSLQRKKYHGIQADFRTKTLWTFLPSKKKHIFHFIFFFCSDILNTQYSSQRDSRARRFRASRYISAEGDSEVVYPRVYAVFSSLSNDILQRTENVYLRKLLLRRRDDENTCNDLLHCSRRLMKTKIAFKLLRPI